MNTDNQQLSILIPAYNEERNIGKVISSVRASMAALGEDDYEVVVCNNNSADGTGEAAVAAGARVVFEPHNQIARARNAAAGVATGGWFIFIDADSELSAALLGETLRKIRRENVGAGGALVELDREDLGWHVALGVGSWNLLSRLMNWAAGSYIYCSRQAWEETGGFDEEWYAAEEILFSRALKRWCRKNGLRFSVITRARLRTSSRKIDAYSLWQTFRLVVRLASPGALKNRERCQYWYDRS